MNSLNAETSHLSGNKKSSTSRDMDNSTLHTRKISDSENKRSKAAMDSHHIEENNCKRL